MPSILIECGFLTNPKEEDFLHSGKGQDYLASAIFRAFRAYKENFEDVSSEKKVIEPIIVEKEKTTKIPETKKEITTDKIIFKVQIGTYLKSMLNKKLFKEMNAQEQMLNGTFRYYVGAEIDKSKADSLKIKMRENGFKGAFVVAFYKDKRISVKEALGLQTKNKSHE